MYHCCARRFLCVRERLNLCSAPQILEALALDGYRTTDGVDRSATTSVSQKYPETAGFGVKPKNSKTGRYLATPSSQFPSK
jgi:hypothetical protein